VALRHSVRVRVDDGLRDHICRKGEWCVLVIENESDAAVVHEALTEAARVLGNVRHPDEPSEPLANFIEVDTDRVPATLTFDIKDYGPEYADVIVDILIEAMARVRGDGVLRSPSSEVEQADNVELPLPIEPDPIVEPYGASIRELDARGLPPSFPHGFPIPAGATLVAAARSSEGAEQATWRRDTGALDFGDVVDALTAAGFTLKKPKAKYRILWPWQPMPKPNYPEGSNVRLIARADGHGGVWTYYRTRGDRRDLGYLTARWRAQPPAYVPFGVTGSLPDSDR
jgi:hypothetical protein